MEDHPDYDAAVRYILRFAVLGYGTMTPEAEQLYKEMRRLDSGRFLAWAHRTNNIHGVTEYIYTNSHLYDIEVPRHLDSHILQIDKRYQKAKARGDA
jgi:hypothetical protein